MFIVYVAVTAVTIAAALWSTWVDVVRPQWLLDNMAKVDVTEAQLPYLAGLKAVGGLGLLVGFVLPAVGVAAAAGLVLYFVLAIATVVRAPDYAQIPYPTVFLLLSAATLTLQLVEL
jgi:DoxX-like protein